MDGVNEHPHQCLFSVINGPMQIPSRVSIGTCAISVVGIPALLFIGSDVPAAGQLAVGGTTLAATVGSTLLLNVCVSPYVLRMFEVSFVDECLRSQL